MYTQQVQRWCCTSFSWSRGSHWSPVTAACSSDARFPCATSPPAHPVTYSLLSMYSAPVSLVPQTTDVCVACRLLRASWGLTKLGTAESPRSLQEVMAMYSCHGLWVVECVGGKMVVGGTAAKLSNSPYRFIPWGNPSAPIPMLLGQVYQSSHYAP